MSITADRGPVAGDKVLFVTFAVAFNPDAERLVQYGQGAESGSEGDVLFAALLAAMSTTMSDPGVINACLARLIGHGSYVEHNPHNPQLHRNQRSHE